MERPLHLCEILEQEHYALNGKDWRVTPADIIDANELAKRALERFGGERFGTIRKWREPVPGAPPVDLNWEKKGIADDLNRLVLDAHDDAENNRRMLDQLLAGSLRAGDNFGWLYDRDQIRVVLNLNSRWTEVLGDPPEKISKLTHYPIDIAREHVAAELNRLVEGPLLDGPRYLAAVSPRTSKLLDEANEQSDAVQREDIDFLNRAVVDDIFRQFVQRGEDARLAKIYEVIHTCGKEKPSSALCISGGGIRSATFGLGVLQGLSQRNLLPKFDYLSTVSGGGYIGGWLSSWIRRHADGSRGVAEELAKAPADKLTPDPPPVRHLREFSNYLTPRVGALSGDTLVVAAIYLRNLLLNWFILIPLLVAGLAVPRLINAVYFRSVRADVGDALFQWSQGLLALTARITFWAGSLTSRWQANGHGWLWSMGRQLLFKLAGWLASMGVGILTGTAKVVQTLAISVANRALDPLMIFSHAAHWISGVALAIMTVYLAMSRPSGRGNPTVDSSTAHKRYVRLCLVPMLVAAVAMTAAWIHGTMTALMVGFFILVPLVAGICFWVRFHFFAGKGTRGGFFAMTRAIRLTEGSFFAKTKRLWLYARKDVIETIGALIASGFSLGVLALLAAQLFHRPIPMLTLNTFPSPVLSLTEELPLRPLYVCFAVPLVLSVLFLSASIFVGVASSVDDDHDREWWSRSSGYLVGAIAVWIVITATVAFGPILISFAPKIAVSLGGISGIVSLVLGRSARTPAKGEGEPLPMKIALTIAAPLFVLFILAGLALLTSKAYAPDEIVTPAQAAVLEKSQWSVQQKYDAATSAAGIKSPNAPHLEWQNPGVLDGKVEVTAASPQRPMFDRMRFGGWNHLRAFCSTQFVPTAVLIVLGVLLALVASTCVNVNKFSMHSMYRNRLIRAYLGASRGVRAPNPLTGFDAEDNVAMHLLRPELLWPTSFIDFPAFVQRLRDDRSEFVRGLRDLLQRHSPDILDTADIHELTVEVFLALNVMLETEDFSKLVRAKQRVSFRQLLKDIDVRAAARSFASNVKEFVGKTSNFFTTRGGSTPIPEIKPRKRRPKVTSSVTARILRNNRELLDSNFPQQLYPYDAPLLRRGDVQSMSAIVKHFGKVRRVPIRSRKAPDEPMVPAAHPYPSSNTKITLRERSQDATSLEGSIANRMTETAWQALLDCDESNPHAWDAVDLVLCDWNRLLNEYDFSKFALPDPHAADVPNPYPVDYERVRRNRHLLEKQFADAIQPLAPPRPIHVVNVALNLVGGDNLAWQERKAESFTVSPMHSGSVRLGYRDSARYGGAAEGISLGTAVTISGAAVSPNMGYHSSTGLAFLMTLFNVRLGWWLGNPGPHGANSWMKEGPQPAVSSLLAEALGETNDRFNYVYLSDGGHFENLGLYEMVLRRCHFIIVSDATGDPDFTFDDLGNAIRKIRTDLGVPIDIEKMCIYPRAHEAPGKYCALGTIRYTAVDRNAIDGRFLYIKPAVYMTEPKDIFNYAESNPAFPHETTGDQWFSESQFESYRMLGKYVIDQICLGAYEPPRTAAARAAHANWTASSVPDFFNRAEQYLAAAKEEARKYRAAEARA